MDNTHNAVLLPPTLQFYHELQEAFDHFNRILFSHKLPSCIITLQREVKSYGYYSVKRFVNLKGDLIDEIALNPEYFAIRSIPETLSTLVHEMVHLQQQHFGVPGRSRYHNQEWANWMEHIGLIPSHTGKEGGKRTGDRMSHYILKSGRFDHACQILLTKDYQLSWMDRFPPRKNLTEVSRSLPTLVNLKKDPKENLPNRTKLNKNEHNLEASLPLGAALLGSTIPFMELSEELELDRLINRSNRVKYRCQKCHNQVWGRPKLNIICGDCKLTFISLEN